MHNGGPYLILRSMNHSFSLPLYCNLIITHFYLYLFIPSAVYCDTVLCCMHYADASSLFNVWSLI